MNKQFKKQLAESKHNTVDDLQHLGFNAGEGGTDHRRSNQGTRRASQK